MVELYQWYSILSIATSSVALVLAVLVYRRFPGKRPAMTFVLAMSFFLGAALLSYPIRYSYDEYEGGPLLMWSTRLFYFVHMLAVGYTAAFVGMYFYGFQVFRRRGVATFLNFSLGAAAVLVASLVGERPTPTGPMPVNTSARLALVMISTFYGLLMLATIGRTLLRSVDGVVRRQATVMLGGILLHGATAETYAYLRQEGLFPPPFLTVSALVMASMFAIAVLRFRMFEVTPRPEQPEPMPRKFPLKTGRAYLVRERTGDTALRAVSEAARAGSPALVITRRPPKAVREDFDLDSTPVLWLTTNVGQNHVPPTDAGLLSRLVGEFIERAEHPVIAVEGLEYIASYVGSASAARAIQSIRDAVMDREGTIVLSVNPDGLDESQVTVIEREFEPLEIPRDPAVEDAYVITKGGLLVTRAARVDKPETDRDVMAGMLTAIMNFVRYSFAEGSEELRRLELGGRTVAIERSENVILAVVFRGSEPGGLRDEMQSFLKRTERRFGDTLNRWSGSEDDVPGLHAMTWRLLA